MKTEIPTTVTNALDELRLAVQDVDKTDTAKLVATVHLRVVCNKAEISLKAVDVKKRTGASASYVSQVWRATDTAVKRRRDPVKVAQELGYNAFIKKFLVVKRPRKSSAPSAFKILDQLKQSVRVLIEHGDLDDAGRAKLHQDLVWLASEVIDVRPTASQRSVREEEHVIAHH